MRQQIQATSHIKTKHNETDGLENKTVQNRNKNILGNSSPSDSWI